MPCTACAAHCIHCDAPDRGAAKCNDGACETGYTIDGHSNICTPGKTQPIVIVVILRRGRGEISVHSS